jgi:hypothetical protein
MCEANAVTVNRSPGEVSEELSVQLWLKWEGFEPYEGQPGELGAALESGKNGSDNREPGRGTGNNSTQGREGSFFIEGY